jgi:hypothetical protein
VALAIFGKVGNSASEDVIIRLVECKCLPVLFYGLEACPLSKSQTNSLQFAMTGALMKIFKTSSKDVIAECMLMFNLQTVHDAVLRRKSNFLLKYMSSTNALCNALYATALNEFEGLSV